MNITLLGIIIEAAAAIAVALLEGDEE